MNNDVDETTYAVTAKRWKHGWELHIEGVGVTQSKTLNDAEEMARDYIALDTGAPPGSFNVEITPEVSQELDRQAHEARIAVVAAEKALTAAAARSREVARGLKGIGLSGREIAVVLRVSPQRVSQLLRAKKKGASHSEVSRLVTRAATATSAAASKVRATTRQHTRS